MTGQSKRMKIAVDYLVEGGYAKSYSDVAMTTGIAKAALSMIMNGVRTPSSDHMLAVSDHFPINFWWLRSGEGNMIGDSRRENELLMRISDVEREMEGIEARVRELVCLLGKRP